MLVDGTAGVGATRFIDEAIARVAALQEPMTVLRAAPSGRARTHPTARWSGRCGPPLAELSDDELGAVHGHRAPTSWSGCSRARATGRGRERRRRRAPTRQLTTVPERRQARLLEGVLGVLGRLGERRPVAPRHRGPPPRRRRDADARELPRPDRSGAAAGDRRHLPGRHPAARRPVVARPGAARRSAASARASRPRRRWTATIWPA